MPSQRKIPSARTRCLMTFNNTEATASPFQRLSTHLMLEPGITRATKVTSRASATPKVFSKEDERSRRRFSQCQSKSGSPLQAWAFKFPSKAHTDDLSSALQFSFQTVKQTRLETQDLFGVNCHRKYHFAGAHKAAESLRLVRIFYSV